MQATCAPKRRNNDDQTGAAKRMRRNEAAKDNYDHLGGGAPGDVVGEFVRAFRAHETATLEFRAALLNYRNAAKARAMDYPPGPRERFLGMLGTPEEQVWMAARVKHAETAAAMVRAETRAMAQTAKAHRILQGVEALILRKAGDGEEEQD